MKKILIDWENNAEPFWEALAKDENAPAEFKGDESFIVSDARAAEILAYCEKLPGWDDGPSYARHPILIQDA